MNDAELWVLAVAASDMGISVANTNVIETFAKALAENAPSATLLQHKWMNMYGSLPDTIRHILEFRPNTPPQELARKLASTRYNYLTLAAKPVHRYQVRTAAVKLTDNNSTHYRGYRQKNYVRTHAHLIAAENLSDAEAAAHALLMHTSSTPTPSVVRDAAAVRPLTILNVPPSDAHNLDLPSQYLGVDFHGNLVHLDASRGSSPLSCAAAVPTEWIARVNPNRNIFLAGDTSTAVLLTINDTFTAAYHSPVVLPAYPDNVITECGNKWITWENKNGKVRAIQWSEIHENSTLETDANALVIHTSKNTPYGEGNGVWVGDTAIAWLPPGESITTTHGGTRAFDAWTTNGDWWRVDSTNHTAHVVGMPGLAVACVAPLVNW